MSTSGLPFFSFLFFSKFLVWSTFVKIALMLFLFEAFGDKIIVWHAALDFEILTDKAHKWFNNLVNLSSKIKSNKYRLPVHQIKISEWKIYWNALNKISRWEGMGVVCPLPAEPKWGLNDFQRPRSFPVYTSWCSDRCVVDLDFPRGAPLRSASAALLPGERASTYSPSGKSQRLAAPRQAKPTGPGPRSNLCWARKPSRPCYYSGLIGKCSFLYTCTLTLASAAR